MPRFHVFLMTRGERRKVATVDAEGGREAKERIAESRDLCFEDLDFEPMQVRVDLTCAKCGWVFKGRAHEWTRDPTWIRCTVCKQSDVVEARAHDFLRAKKTLEEMQARRALEKERRGDAKAKRRAAEEARAAREARKAWRSQGS